ncbi:hypothetical protein KDC22_14625 [Paenibacillus tritici]|uniref:hypothetical protein n=1 Tax=Paenibacillus tritici TaxID=1873425 RepID=UPI001BA92041|nr:hypothetical protein [Paenibacillus tritici]QUL57601.1 hypothetical protein KDC22_14625 [Paenibacillus tritici]
MAKKTIYKLEQLPSSIEADRMEWSGDDWNIWIERTDNNKMRLRGESLEWEEENDRGDGEWRGTPMNRDEILDIAEAVKLIIPNPKGNKLLTEIFKRKTPTQ